MKNKSTFLLFMFLMSLNAFSQKRSSNRLEPTKMVKFEFKAGVQKVKIPNSKSVLTLQINGRDPKIERITKTENGKTYTLKQVKFSSCSFKGDGAVGCWKDPKTQQCICISKPRNSSDDGEITGQIEFLSPN